MVSKARSSPRANDQEIRTRVLIDGPQLQTNALLDALATVNVAAQPMSPRLRTALRQVLPADIVQLTAFIECDRAKTEKVFTWARLLGKKTVRYWVGSDVWFAVKSSNLRRMAHRINSLTDGNVVVASHLVDELADIGIRATCLLSPQDKVLVEEVPPMPTDFAVLFYSVRARMSFYGLPLLLRLARSSPGVRFDVVGDNGVGLEAPANVRFLGRVKEMSPVYAGSSALLRFLPHDGLSRMILEAFGRARPVIYNHPFPHCIMAKTFDEVGAALAALASDPKPNVAGLRFVRENYCDNRHALRMKDFYEALCRRRSWLW